MTSGWLIAAGLCGVLAAVAMPSAAPRSSDAGAALERFLTASDRDELTSYHAFRAMEAESRGGRMRARLTACTHLDSAGGFRYTILEEEGSGLIRSKVLRAALETERTLRATGANQRAALTPANYEFSVADPAEGGLVPIALRPRRRDTLLIDGRMLVTAGDADLVRVEGALSKRPSFWTRRVDVVRRYGRIGGVRVPLAMQSTAQVLFAGASSFSMTYEYAAVNGAGVASTPRAAACADGPVSE